MGIELMKEASFDTGQVKINYAAGPNSGPALVLIHGGSARWQYFYDILPDLTRFWQVYAPDLRGHGASDRVSGGYTLPGYAEDIRSFLEHVSGPAVLFGHSLGGMIALWVAGHYPEWVRAVMVGDSPLDQSTHKAILDRRREELRKWKSLAGGSHSVDEITAALGSEHLAARLFLQDPEVLGVLLDDFECAHEGYEMEKLFPAIHCPVLLLQADPNCGGAMTDAEVAQALRLLAQPRHVKFPGLSHLLYVEDKDSVLAAMKEFSFQEKLLPGR